MSNFLLLVSSILFCLIVPSVNYTCIHHNISLYDVPVGASSHQGMRAKRHGDAFRSLSIHVYMDDFDTSVSKNIRSKIDVALKRVVKFFWETLKVKQTFTPFLLERHNCAQKWHSGLNKDKCSRLRSGPEFCSTKLTDYIIPDRYLNKLEVYDYNDTQPQHVIKSGQGIQDSNFILFVISRTSSWCAENDVQAYGSYCRLDSDSRPVAGLLNMCPSKFSKKLFRASHYFNVIMHEVIHILGFSHHLYSKFRTCSSVYDCEIPKKIVHRDENDIQRLVFPELVKSMQTHFNCSEAKFGAPLEQYDGDSTIFNENEYTSHWHPVLMYSSIMTPSLLEESYAVIDNITLALLYSTGWYKVNFQKAQKFMFGKGQGCNFGFGDKCEVSDYDCLPSINATMCDILDLTIGKCENVVPFHPCIYKSYKKETCLENVEGNLTFDMHPAVFEHRCVSLQDGSNSEDPYCVVRKCRTVNKLNVSINSSRIFCSHKEESFNEKRSICLNNSLAISVHIYFSNSSTFLKQIDKHNFTNFKESAVGAIAESINISTNYIVNVTLSTLNMVRLDFSVCPPSNSSHEELVLLIKKTKEFLQYSHLNVFNRKEEMPVSTTNILLKPGVAVSSSGYEGLYRPPIMSVLCGVFVMTAFIASIL